MVTPRPVARTLSVPGARLHYEVRGSGPVLLVVGAPMGAAGFTALAQRLAADRTVVTYDPRGLGRSTVEDPDLDVSPQLMADDLRHLLAAVADGPVELLGSSGGATTGLALVSRYPENVRTLVAHEPPLLTLLPDAAEMIVEVDEVRRVLRESGPAPAFARFLELAGSAPSGPGLPGQGDAAERDRAVERDGGQFLSHFVRPLSFYRPDIAALRSVPTRVVVAAGAASAGQSPRRAAAILARELDTPLVEFPSGHAGFLHDPDAFAETLLAVLADR